MKLASQSFTQSLFSFLLLSSFFLLPTLLHPPVSFQKHIAKSLLGSGLWWELGGGENTASALRGQTNKHSVARGWADQGWLEPGELSLEAKTGVTWWSPLSFGSHFSAQTLYPLLTTRPSEERRSLATGSKPSYGHLWTPSPAQRNHSQMPNSSDFLTLQKDPK